MSSSPYLSGLLGGGPLGYSLSSQHFDELHSSNAASSAGSSHSAATLSHLLGHAASSPYSFDSTAASFLSKFVSRPPSDAVTTASVIPVSPSSSATAAASYPLPYQSSLSAASLRLKSGSSCHQCKTNKEPPHLYFCATKQDTATGKRNCRKKYCVACFPESDTRVLTSAGFLFLADIEQRIRRGQQTQYACYDTTADSIVYSDGELVHVEPPTRWVDFTQADTRPLWDDTSDDYGSTTLESGERANRLTLRTTPGHDMYVQLCTASGEGRTAQHAERRAGNAEFPAHKMPAQELAPGYKCDCAARSIVCTHGYSHYRMSTGAASGLHRPADIFSRTGSDDFHSRVAALGLHSKDELDAFLEVFGYWLGDGTLSHGSCAGLSSADAVCFAPRKDCDHGYLLGLLARVHLERGQHFTSSESDSRLEVCIIEPRWFLFFDDEFGVKYSNSRPHDKHAALLKQGMHKTQPSSSTASPVSSTRALGISTSASFSLNASVADQRNDDDMSLLMADPVEVEEEAEASAKWLPDWAMFRLGTDQLRLVIEGVRHAEGSSAAGDKVIQGHHKLCTSNIGFRDQLIHACLHAGYSAYFELNTAAGEVVGYNAVPYDMSMYTEEAMGAALRVDSTRQFEAVRSRYDSWRVCYSESVSELLPAQDVRFDGSPCRVRQQAAAIDTQPADLYDQQRDGRVWCVEVKHKDHLIFVQRVHRNDRGVVTKVGRTIVTGNCMSRWYKQLGMTGVPGLLQPSGPGWSCPSCCGQCVCAACDRKKEKANRKAAEEGSADGSAGDDSVKCDTEAHDCGKSEASGGCDVVIGVKRERSESCSDEADDERVSVSPRAKHAKMEISPPLNAVSASAVSFASPEQKNRSPSTMVLPRPPPGYNRLQSEPNMPAFASPLQPSRAVPAAAQIAHAIVAPLPPHAARGQHNAHSRPAPAPFQVPALPVSSSSSSASSASSSSSTPLYFDPMQEAAVRAISRFYHNQQQQQQRQHHQHQLQASRGYAQPNGASAYDHMRRVSDEVPSLTNFSSNTSSSVSTPIPNTPPTHYSARDDAPLAFALDTAPTAHVTAAAGGGMQLKALPAQPPPLLTSASRAITVPVTVGETDRHTAVRAIQSIGLLNFDIGGPSPPVLSLAASPSLSPVVSVPSTPRSLTAWRSSLSLVASSAQLASTFDALTSDPFHPSPLFNPLLPAGPGSASTADTPRNVGGQTPVQFWIKSGVNSLCGTPRGAHLAAGGGGAVGQGRTHGSRGGSMGEMEFQALFN